ncbi:50S ribosomal protein L33 [Shouchella sp. JSM 1781072]|nr:MULTISPECIES: 50S ribosomal protein L33 [Bacillaceae]UTR06594.1 50S ribosomal protein L33 [Alkalihalobacillus sp. LMS6]
MTKRILACERCQARNYSYPAENKTHARLEMKKFCKRCNEHTLHLETK